MRKIILIVVALAAVATASGVFAQTSLSPLPALTFPISELGGCNSRDECKTYCDDIKNKDACLSFARVHKLMTDAQLSAARSLLAKAGPGGCSSALECKAYCADSTHSEACIAFAQSHGLVATSTAILAKKITTTGGPGGCSSGAECKTYCSEFANVNECTQFAHDNGLKQADTETKIVSILSETKGPGGCSDLGACKTYCALASHGTECRQFALEHQLITNQQFEQANTFASTTGPGGCRGEQCKVKCSDPALRQECLNFAVKVGVITHDAASSTQRLENIITTQGGPGGCNSTEACKAFCNTAEHHSECAAFLNDHQISPPPVPPPLPQRDPTNTLPSNILPSGKIICRTIDECKRLCAGNTSLCQYIPLDGQAAPTPTTIPLVPRPPLVPGSTTPPPLPKPTDTPTPTGTNTTKIICHTTEECKLRCATNTANCQYIPYATVPTTTTTQPSSPLNTQPPMPSTKIICHTYDECKVLCGTNTVNCQYVPNSTPTNTPPPQPPPPPPLPHSSTTNTSGASVITAILHFFGF